MRTIQALASLAAKRRERFLECVDHGFGRLLEAGVVDDVPEDDSFHDVLIHATELALHTSEEEKLLAFANIVLNSALAPPPDDQSPHAFLLSLDRIPLLHLQLLRCLNSPAKHFRSSQGIIRSAETEGNTVALFELIFEMFPSLSPRIDSRMHARVLYELHGQNLIHGIDRKRDHFSSNDDAFRVTTTYGSTLIRLISPPDLNSPRTQRRRLREKHAERSESLETV